MDTSIFTPSYTMRNTFLGQGPTDPLAEFRKTLLTKILSADRQAPMDSSPEGLKSMGILDKATLKKQYDGNEKARESEMGDAAIGTGLGVVAGTLANLLSGNNNVEGLLQNSLPGINAVQQLMGKQSNEEATDREAYTTGVNKFYNTLFNVHKSNRETKQKNTELDINTLKALKEGAGNDFSAADIFADENDLAYTKKTNRETGAISIEPVIINGTHIKLRKPTAEESLGYRKERDVKKDTQEIQENTEKLEKEWRGNHKLIGLLTDQKTAETAKTTYIQGLVQSNPALAVVLAGKKPEEILQNIMDNQMLLEQDIKKGNPKFDDLYTKKRSTKINLKSTKRELPKAQ